MTTVDKPSKAAPHRRDPAQKRVLAVLTASQVLAGIGVATGISISTLAASNLSGSETVGGLAQTSAVAGAAILALPMARAAARRGRRPALSLAYGSAAVGMLIAALASALESWPLLLFGLFLAGGGTAGGLAARYAATDLSAPGHTARDLSIVVWATTVGSIAGPNLAGPADSLGRDLGLAAWSGPYWLAAAAFGVTVAGIWLLLRPDPLHRTDQAAAPDPQPARSGGRHVLRRNAVARTAVAVIVVSHTVMVAVMVMTPVHLDRGDAGLTIVGMVISVHIAGMYALSPVTGWLADRWGRIPVLLVGMALLAAAATLAALSAPHEVTLLTVALFLLGLGWSCGLVGGSALLTDAVEPDERPAVQGLSDLLMNGGAAIGGVAAGFVVTALSYGALATIALGLVFPMAAALLLTRRK